MKKLKEKLSSTLWIRVLSYVLIPFYTGLCFLNVEYLNYKSLGDIVYSFRDLKKPVFAMMILLLITAGLVLICKKLWIFALTFGVLTTACGIVNFTKLAFNGDYFFPWDFTMVGNMGDLIGYVNFRFPPLFWVFMPLIIAFILFFYLVDTGIPLKWYYCVPSGVLVLSTFVIAWQFPTFSNGLLEKFGMGFAHSVLQSDNYTVNGFVNAFTINAYAMNMEEPEQYSKENVLGYISNYDTIEAAEKPDVIVIMSESFTDIRTLTGTQFSQNPLENFDSIAARDGAASGRLYCTALGGGTVRTEFEVLTGLTVDHLLNSTSPYIYVKDDIETYVSNYKEQGYKTTAIHSYTEKFYMRNIAYPRLGFDDFISVEDIEKDYEYTTRRGYVTDDTFMDVVIDTLEKDGDEPSFIFGITMENHQSYKKSDESDIVVKVTNDAIDDETLDAVTTYTQGVYYADKSLKKLVDYIDAREKPTVILFFGDHLPTLGASQAAYNQAGVVSINDGYDAAERDFLYATPYIVYSNYGADLSVFEDKKISSYYMLSLLADSTGTRRTPYMQYLSNSFLNVPYYNVRLMLEENDATRKLANSMMLITYDRIAGNNYTA